MNIKRYLGNKFMDTNSDVVMIAPSIIGLATAHELKQRNPELLADEAEVAFDVRASQAAPHKQ